MLACVLNTDQSADAVTIRLHTLQFDPQSVVLVAAIVSEEDRRPGIGGNQKVKVAIIINVSVCGAASYTRCIEGCACVCRDFRELASALITKEMRRLAVLDALLDFLDITLNVPVSDKNIRPAIKIVVKKEAAESQCEK